MVGNKIDLERQVPEGDAKQLSQQYGINYYETSAKKNLGLKECFDDIFE